MVGGYIGYSPSSTVEFAEAIEVSSIPAVRFADGAIAVSSAPATAVTTTFPASTGVTGGGTESGAQRVTIANNSTGVLSIDDGGGTLTVDGTVTAGIQPSTSYLSHVYIDLDSNGDNPATNTEVVAAPGSGNQLVIYGIQGSFVAAGASDFGNWFLSDGNTSAATTLWTGRTQGVTPSQFSISFPFGLALTANTALKVTSTEGSGNIYINAVVYYQSVST
tara:strand:+ start:295 stop:954 length:660 start_codon:yes stop_codon:yes gene_type:complete